MKMPFEDNSFDAVYAIEATCHAPDAVCEIFLTLFSFTSMLLFSIL